MITLLPVNSSMVSEIIRIWNSCPELGAIDYHKLAFVLFANENYRSENTLTAWEDGELLGFILGIRRQYPYMNRGLEAEKGWILCQATAPAFRHHGVGRLLLQTLEKRWNAEGVSHITLSSFSPYYFFPGIEQNNLEAVRFYSLNGYHPLEYAYWMERSLENLSVPPAILSLKERTEKDGYCYLPFSWEYALPLINFVALHFSTGWQHHIRQTILSGQAEDIIQLCLHNDSIVGYLQRKMDGDDCRLGPFGIAPDHRNKGIGTVLLWEMWKSMQHYDLNHVFFQSTDEPGKRFYERQGMSVSRFFCHYEKNSIN